MYKRIPKILSSKMDGKINVRKEVIDNELKRDVNYYFPVKRFNVDTGEREADETLMISESDFESEKRILTEKIASLQKRLNDLNTLLKEIE